MKVGCDVVVDYILSNIKYNELKDLSDYNGNNLVMNMIINNKRNRRYDAIRKLVIYGNFNLNKVNNNGHTSLMLLILGNVPSHFKVYKHHRHHYYLMDYQSQYPDEIKNILNTFKLLIKYNVNPFIRDNYGRSALSMLNDKQKYSNNLNVYDRYNERYYLKEFYPILIELLENYENEYSKSNNIN